MFLTNLFDNLGWTRDDAKWIIGVTAAIVVGLATLSDSAAAALAIPAGALPYIRLGAFIVGIVSANYKTSGLPGRVWLLPVLLAVGLTVTSCASANGKLAAATSQAIKTSEQLHCTAPGAPATPLCLNDGQFQRVNADLVKVSAAGLAYTEIAAAAQKAKQQPPADALVTLVAAISSAMADIAQAAGTSSTAILQQLEKALRVL